MNIVQEKIKYRITLRHKIYDDKNKPSILNKSWHKNIEICKVVSGNIEMTINNQTFLVSPGDMVIINSGEIHRFEMRSEVCIVDICTFDPLILYNFGTDYSITKTHIKANEIAECGIEEQISDCFNNLFSEKNNGDSSSKIIMQADILKIYGLLSRNFQEEKKDEASLSKLNSFHKIIEYISDNYSEEITLESLSKKFNYSTVYISSSFSTCAGVNFKYYLDNVRVSKSIEFLNETTLTISQIALNCGFSNIRTFNNVFKKITGSTPKAVRNN